MRTLGTICRLQVQRVSLKQGMRPQQYYAPAGIVSVPALRVEADGVVGLTGDDEILDVHHAAHPASRNRGGLNGISVNVTGNYAQMTARFGPRLTLGVAGENIIVHHDQVLRPDSLGDSLVVRTQDGHEIVLDHLIPAPPCEPFSRFALGDDEFAPAAWVKETLQFLNHGMRGYYATATGAPFRLQLGDEVLIP